MPLNKGENIVLRQSSMQGGDTVAEKEADLREVFRPGPYGMPDFICFTEMSPVMETFAEAQALNCGYRYFGSPSDGGIAVRIELHKVRKVGYVKTLETNIGMVKGNYGERGIAFVSVRTAGGNEVTDHVTHWLTQYQLDRNPGNESRRERRFGEQTTDMIEQVKMHALGRRISFWQGDTNIDEALDTTYDKDALEYRFQEAGLLSIYDEVKKYPTTHGRNRTIDVIGSYNPDKRVVGLDVHVAPRRNSDHSQVDARYLIKP